ncbi:MAG: hypothetical protein LLF76_10500 [Planctomycetaceae bacterium]|nr:hypothetical protein [Planctomycetaceae bacterium]
MKRHQFLFVTALIAAVCGMAWAGADGSAGAACNANSSAGAGVDVNELSQEFTAIYGEEFVLEGVSVSNDKRYLNFKVKPTTAGIHCATYSVVDTRNQYVTKYTFLVLVGETGSTRIFEAVGMSENDLHIWPGINLGDSIVLPVACRAEYSAYRFIPVPQRTKDAYEQTYTDLPTHRAGELGRGLFEWLEGKNPVAESLRYLGTKKADVLTAALETAPLANAVFEAVAPAQFNLKLYGAGNPEQFTVVPIRILGRDERLTGTVISVQGRTEMGARSSSGESYRLRQEEVVMRAGDKIEILYWQGPRYKGTPVGHPKIVIEKLPFEKTGIWFE